VRTKYTTDEEDYTQSESISFALLFNQAISQATTVLAGFAYDNIYYVFDIEVSQRSSRVTRRQLACSLQDGKPKIIFSQDDLPDVVLTTGESNPTLIGDGQWHRLNVERVDRKVRRSDCERTDR
jgi:hypothetical protein